MHLQDYGRLALLASGLGLPEAGLTLIANRMPGRMEAGTGGNVGACILPHVGPSPLLTTRASPFCTQSLGLPYTEGDGGTFWDPEASSVDLSVFSYLSFAPPPSAIRKAPSLPSCRKFGSWLYCPWRPRWG